MCLPARVLLDMQKWKATIIEPHNTHDSHAIVETWGDIWADLEIERACHLTVELNAIPNGSTLDEIQSRVRRMWRRCYGKRHFSSFAFRGRRSFRSTAGLERASCNKSGQIS